MNAAPGPDAASASTRGDGAAGKVALGFGIATVLAGIASHLASSMLPLIMQRRNLPADTVGQILVPIVVVHCLLALVALVSGLVGLLQPGQPRAAAGAGTALGAAALAGVIAPTLGALAIAALS